MKNKILISIITGARPDKKRTTERVIKGIEEAENIDVILFSNNSEGYHSDYPIINVPQEYRDYYHENHEIDFFGKMAPMNRTYSDKWAKENGYDINVQLDDNIHMFRFTNYDTRTVYTDKRYYLTVFKQFLDAACTAINEGLAEKVGCELPLPFTSKPITNYRTYVYSCFAVNLHAPIPPYIGSTEDDITDCYRRAEMGMRTLKLTYFQYGKSGAVSGKDNTGSRAAYEKLVNTKHGRGWVQDIIYPYLYSSGWGQASVGHVNKDEQVVFKHKLKQVPTDDTSLDERLLADYRAIQKFYKESDCKTNVAFNRKQLDQIAEIENFQL